MEAAGTTAGGTPAGDATGGVDVPVRSPADLRMRRILRLPVSGPRARLIDPTGAASRSIAISAVRCLITYVAIPLLRPVADLSGALGPALGIVLSIVSAVAIVVSARRFFAADHAWRWKYAAVGGGILVLVVVQGVLDVVTLLT
jgi:hypothetical protein